MKVKARDFDKKFDKGADISKHLDLKKAKRPEQEQKRESGDFPVRSGRTFLGNPTVK